MNNPLYLPRTRAILAIATLILGFASAILSNSIARAASAPAKSEAHDELYEKAKNEKERG